jgi:hypothetical protein
VIAAISDKLRTRRTIKGNKGLINMKSRRGIIFTVGLQSHTSDSPLNKVINTLKPEFFGFIETQRTINEKIVNSIVTNNSIKDGHFKSTLVDPTNIDEIRTNVSNLVKWMLGQGISSEDIVVDLTGGTATVSVAAFTTAAENGIETQYVFSQFDDKNRPIPNTQQLILLKMV